MRCKVANFTLEIYPILLQKNKLRNCSQSISITQVNLIGNKGFGFVEMSSAEEAEKAKEALNGTSFSGRTIIVDEARPQRDRPQRNFGNKRY